MSNAFSSPALEELRLLEEIKRKDEFVSDP